MNHCLGYYLLPHPPIAIPEIGKGEEQEIHNTIDACKFIGKEISQLAPETIIMITPHGPVFSDAIALSHEKLIEGNLSRFNAPSVNMKLDIDLVLTEKIMNLAKLTDIQTVGTTEKFLNNYNRKYELDHGSIVPLYYINQFYKNYKIVHITYGMLSFIELYHFGMLIKEAISQTNHKAVIIASGDLSHRLSDEGPYTYSAKGSIFDDKILNYLETGDSLEIFNMDKIDIEEAGECGFRSILMLLGAMGQFNGKKLSYEGPFGVGYGVMSFQKNNQDDNYSVNLLAKLKKNEKNKFIFKMQNSDIYVRLARHSLVYYFENEKIMDIPEDIPEELINKHAGVFVSLKKYGSLRGCIGTFLPTKSTLAEEIIHNAIEAAFEDPRFSPLEEKELKEIDISVDVLSEPKKASIEDLDPKIYGVIVSFGRKRGLLLPNLEGVNTVSEQLEIACQKAGIDPNNHFDIERFKVVRHIEGEV
ncbi:AmmeMemoRadiSam system protein A [Mycoplasmatota bacterium]|nr:AmmeMemoRadiSam system protein A [Mycoplasmatota bacterium]